MMAEIKRALLIGINNYPNQYRLRGAASDAERMAKILATHEPKTDKEKKGKANFDTTLITSLSDSPVTTRKMSEEIKNLFAREADSVLFYFAGHSHFNDSLSKGYFIPQDMPSGDEGVSFEFLMNLANSAYPRIKSTTIIIDSCNSGAVGEGYDAQADIIPSTIGTGVTILTSSDKRELSGENNLTGGFFTSIIADALKGSAADILGNVTPASLYSHADHLLRSSEQRPIYKANVKSFVVLRECKPRIDADILNELPELFPDADKTFKLDQTYEPEINAPERKDGVMPIDEHTAIFKKLQICNRHSLVEPVDAEHMYFAAMHETGCRLTELGKHYRRLAEENRL